MTAKKPTRVPHAPEATQQVDPTTLEPIMITVYTTPATGATISLSQQRRQVVLINPAGTIATLTVNLPGTPNDGDIVTIGTSQTVTLLTINGAGNAIVSSLTTLLSGGSGRWIWNASAAKWFRIG